MAEQGLKAVVYPELDDAGINEFIKEFQTRLSETFVTVGTKVDTSSDESAPSGLSTAQAPVQPSAEANATDADTKAITKDEQKQIQKDAQIEANKEISKDDESNNAKNKSVTTGLGAVLGTVGSVVSSVASGGIGIVTYIQKVWDFIESSSPALRTVMSLFEQAFSMIWMPVGTIIAKELMPVLSGIMQDVAKWMGRAWDIYEKEGWAGLLSEVFKVSIDILWKYLVGFGEVLWPVLKELGAWILDAFLENIFNIPGGLDTVSKNLDKAVGWLEDVWDEISGPIGDFADNLESEVKSIKSVIDTVSSTLSNIWGKMTGAPEKVVESFKEFSKDPVGSITSSFTSNLEREYKQLKKVIPFLADGGVVTQPTLSVVGEAGPEAIVPLNQLSQVANQYNSSNIGGTVNGGNIMNFYITGNNANEISGEVQRVLEKTVGKASSKMMWW